MLGDSSAVSASTPERSVGSDLRTVIAGPLQRRAPLGAAALSRLDGLGGAAGWLSAAGFPRPDGGCKGGHRGGRRSCRRSACRDRHWVLRRNAVPAQTVGDVARVGRATGQGAAGGRPPPGRDHPPGGRRRGPPPTPAAPPGG